MIFHLLFLLSLSWASAIDPKPIREFIEVLDGHALPAFEGLTPDEKDTNERLPREVYEIFERLNVSAFHRPLLQLKTCRSCRAAADLSALTVFISPEFVRELSEEAPSMEDYHLLLHFVLAHEIGHYIYELAIDSAEGLSLNGNRSFREFKNSYSRCTPERQKAHLEVDLIGVVLMERLGFRNFRRRVSKFIHGMQLPCDGEFRAVGISK